MKLLLLPLVVAFVATRTALEASAAATSGKTPHVDYECHTKKGQGESLKKPVIIKGMQTYGKCVAACIEKKKIVNRIDGVSWGIRGKGCRCLIDMIRIRTSKDLQGNYRACHLRRDEPNEINGVPDGHEVSGPSGVDLTYSYFKDLKCDPTWTRVGCYQAKSFDRYLLNYRYDIEWDSKRFPQFAESFVCACAEAARLNNVQYFATHFWGECWEIDPEAIGEKSTDGCKLADGTYAHACDGIDHGGVCIGTHAYYIYTNVGTETEEDRKKKREAEKREAAKRGIQK